MRTKAEIEARLADVLADPRLGYPAATVDVNAPLALIQMALEAERNVLRWCLQDGENA